MSRIKCVWDTTTNLQVCLCAFFWIINQMTWITKISRWVYRSFVRSNFFDWNYQPAQFDYSKENLKNKKLRDPEMSPTKNVILFYFFFFFFHLSAPTDPPSSSSSLLRLYRLYLNKRARAASRAGDWPHFLFGCLAATNFKIRRKKKKN